MPYQAEKEQLARRQKLLEALEAGPYKSRPTQMVSGRAVPQGILESLSPVIQAMAAKRDLGKIGERRTELDTEQSKGVQEAMKATMDQYTGKPQRPYENEQQFPGEAPIQGLESKAIPADPTGAAMNVATDPYLSQSKPAQAMMQQLMKNKAAGASGSPSPYFTPENTVSVEKDASGKDRYVVRKRVLNRRTGEYKEGEKEYLSEKDPRVLALTAGGKQQAKADVDLAMKPRIDAATKTAIKRAEREHSMDNITSIMDRADSILDEGVATGSGVGSWVDAAGRLVGRSSESAQAAASLEAIGGALTGKMPRFEGPQSDYDREYYQQMAGQVGKRTVPLAERKIALQEVRKLWAKYDKSANQAPESPNAVFTGDKQKRYEEYKKSKGL